LGSGELTEKRSNFRDDEIAETYKFTSVSKRSTVDEREGVFEFGPTYNKKRRHVEEPAMLVDRRIERARFQ
jgi:hypothetical protein